MDKNAKCGLCGFEYTWLEIAPARNAPGVDALLVGTVVQGYRHHATGITCCMACPDMEGGIEETLKRAAAAV